MPLPTQGFHRTPEPFVSIRTFLYSSSPRNNYFYHLSSALWTLCKSLEVIPEIIFRVSPELRR
jgi:hypothetical protein